MEIVCWRAMLIYYRSSFALTGLHRIGLGGPIQTKTINVPPKFPCSLKVFGYPRIPTRPRCSRWQKELRAAVFWGISTFLRLIIRNPRFAKITDQMVSLGAVESAINAVVPEPVEVLSTAIPDGKKGTSALSHKFASSFSQYKVTCACR